MNVDACEVSANNAYLLQRRVPLEGQHRDLAQDLAGWPPPHRDTVAEREGTELMHPRARGRAGPSPHLPPLVPWLWNSPSLASERLVVRTQSSLCHLLALAPALCSPGGEVEAPRRQLQDALGLREV